MNIIKWVLFTCLCLAPSGCVVVETPPQYAPSADRQQGITLQVNVYPGSSTEAEHKVVTLPIPDTPTVSKLPTVIPHKSSCGAFTLPSPTDSPSKPDLQDPRYQTANDVETALVAYANALRVYIREERKRLEIAHREYLRSCGGKSTE